MPKPTKNEPWLAKPDPGVPRAKCWCRWEDIVAGQICREPLYQGCYNRNPLCDEHKAEFGRLILGHS